MTSSHDLSPQAAAVELDRTSSRVRRSARWPAWMFLVLAAVDFAFFVIVGSGNRTLGNALIPLPTLLGVAVFLFAARQRVIGRDAQKINKPVALSAVGTIVAGLIIDQAVLPRHFTMWLVLLAVGMVAPYLVGAWCWLRR